MLVIRKVVAALAVLAPVRFSQFRQCKHQCAQAQLVRRALHHVGRLGELRYRLLRQRLNIGGKLRLQLLGIGGDHHVVTIVSVKPVQRCRQERVALAGPRRGFDQRWRALIQPVS